MAKRKGNKFAIATAQCKKKGHKSFKKGSAGDKCRKKVAEGVARSQKKRRSK